jgi:hypothetical protein
MASRDDFTVSADGHLATNGVWYIVAVLRFRKGLDPQRGDPLLGEGRLALLRAIAREGARGRSHGATAVRVRLDVQGSQTEFDLGKVGVADIFH